MSDDTKITFDPGVLIDSLADINESMLDVQRRMDVLLFLLSFTATLFVGFYVIRQR